MSEKWWKEKNMEYQYKTMYQRLRGFDKFVWVVAMFNAVFTVFLAVIGFLSGLMGL